MKGKSSYIGVVIIFLIILGVVLFIDSQNMLLKNGLNPPALAAFIGSIFAVLGTYLFTKRSVDKQLEKQEEIHRSEMSNMNKLYEKEKRDTKEIAYRNMNKQHSDLLYTEIDKLLERIEYQISLLAIARSFRSDTMFNYTVAKAHGYNVSFAEKVKENFYYDENIVNVCNHIIFADKDNLNLTELKTQYREVKTLFFGFRYSNHEEEFTKAAKEAALTLYQSNWLIGELSDLKLDAYFKCKFNHGFFHNCNSAHVYFRFIDELKEIFNVNSYSKVGGANTVTTAVKYEYTCKENVKLFLEFLHNNYNKESLSFDDRLIEMIRDNYESKSEQLIKSLNNCLDSYVARDQFIELYMPGGLCNYGSNESNEIEKYLNMIQKRFYSKKSINYVSDFLEHNRYI